MQRTSWETLGWMKHKLDSRLPGEIWIPQICRWHNPNGRKQRGTKEPLDESEWGEWKSWRKTQHSKDKDYGIRSHHSWQIDGEIRPHACLLRNLYAGQEATVRAGHGTTDWFQIVKGVRQGCILSPCLFNFYAEYIMRNVGLDEAQAGIKIDRKSVV